MKKEFLCLLCFVLLFTVGGCQKEEAKEKASMSFYPSEFDEETKTIINKYNNDMGYFDYVINGSVKTYTIQIYYLIDGKWEKSNYLFDDNPKKNGRIVYEANKYYIEFMIDDAIYHFENNILSKINEATEYNSIFYRLDKLEKIKLNKEITLFLMAYTKENEIQASNLSGNLKDVKAEFGYAITIKFD